MHDADEPALLPDLPEEVAGGASKRVQMFPFRPDREGFFLIWEVTSATAAGTWVSVVGITAHLPGGERHLLDQSGRHDLLPWKDAPSDGVGIALLHVRDESLTTLGVLPGCVEGDLPLATGVLDFCRSPLDVKHVLVIAKEFDKGFLIDVPSLWTKAVNLVFRWDAIYGWLRANCPPVLLDT